MPRKTRQPPLQPALGLPDVKPRAPRVGANLLNQWIIMHLSQIHNCRVWRNNVAAGKLVRADGTESGFMRFSVPGASDVLGYTPRGHIIAVEGKVDDDLSAEQKAFIEDVQRCGGIGLVVRPNDYQRLIDEALQGEK